MTPAHVPPGWPAGVRPPGTPQWERSAVGWLLDQCPADYRGYPVLARYPAALVHLASLHVAAQVHAGQRALATARSELADLVPPPALVEVIAALELEQARLLAVQRGLGLVEQALGGRRFVPRM